MVGKPEEAVLEPTILPLRMMSFRSIQFVVHSFLLYHSLFIHLSNDIFVVSDVFLLLRIRLLL